MEGFIFCLCHNKEISKWGERLKIRKSEVLRYLGYKGQKLDERLVKLIEDCIKEIQKIANPHYIYQECRIDWRQKKGIVLGKDLVLSGEDIKHHLKGCDKCFVLAATLGPEVDRQIKNYQLVDMTRAVILDTCASEAIEGVCDDAQREIEKIMMQKGYNITSRFSPGYGDLPIHLQLKILSYINAPSKIGLTSTRDSLLIPRKSVTAFIGCSKKVLQEEEKSCNSCNAYEFCKFRKETIDCECIQGNRE